MNKNPMKEDNTADKNPGGTVWRAISRGWVSILLVSVSMGISGAAFAETQKSQASDDGEKSSGDSGGSGKVSAYQSDARPFGLDIAGKVMSAGSDAASADFQKNMLPAVTQFLNKNLPESVNNTKSPVAFSVDPSKLTMQTESQVRVYFVGEGAGYRNTLGFNTEGEGVKSGDPKLIFPDVSSSAAGKPSTSEPLSAGDFVNLGTFAKGTKLDFFLIANGAGGWKDYVYSADSSSNPDHINHVASFTPQVFASSQKNSPYLFIAFEDLLGGGDRDYNDVVFAMDVGAATVRSLVATPEPAMFGLLGSFVLMAMGAKRRMDRQNPATTPFAA